MLSEPEQSHFPEETEVTVKIEITSDPINVMEMAMETVAADSPDVFPVHPGQLCRLCALPTPNMMFIYGEEGIKEELASKINMWLPISVSRKDSLPKQVCDTCIHQLKRSAKFSFSVLRAEYLLRELLTSQSFGFDQDEPKRGQNCDDDPHQSPGVPAGYSCPLCCEGVMAALQGEMVSEGDSETPYGDTTAKFSPEINDILESLDEYHSDKNSVSNLSIKDKVEGSYMQDCELQTWENKFLHFYCRMCGEHLSSSEDLVFHSLQKHGNSNTDFYPCVQCERIFDESSDLVRHCSLFHKSQLSKQVVGLLYVCFTCGGKFSTREHQMGHTCDEVVARELTCKKCDLTFESQEQLNTHIIVHEQGEGLLLVCELCDIHFSDATSFFNHTKEIHTNHEPKEAASYTCDCGRIYQNRSAYLMHLRRHKVQYLFKCDMCSKSFQDKQTLKEHFASHMTVKPFQCQICGKYLNRLSRLKKHLLSHEVEKVEPQKLYCCSNCSQAFPTEEKAIAHVRGDNDGCLDNGNSVGFVVNMYCEVFRCEYCERCYSSHESLNEHRNQHTEPRLFSCSVCKIEFSSYSRLQTHKVGKTSCQIEEGIKIPKMFGCDECYKSYLHWTYLAVHRKLQHAEVKPRYKSFPNSWSVAYHRRTRHPVEEGGGSLSKQKPFRCEVCGRRYVSEISLQHHQSSLHGEEAADGCGTSYQCEECGKVFSRKLSLESHLRSHSGLKPYSCKLCNKTFVHPSGLSSHIRRHKGDMPHSCKYCGKKFLQRSDCNDHERKHTGERPWTCDTCSKTFRTRAMWFEHCRIHRDERPFPCDFCGLAFRRSYALKNHRMIHTGEKNFVCKVCSRAFRVKQDLQKHERLKHQVKETPLDKKKEDVNFVSNYTGSFKNVKLK
ncbi:zinc finger protein 595 isoform X2 [Anabrus simplex]|uniref:zinc finger protein 595 isoform X2 n=1 Tax=Anabrus simplex TaxID=316456 RepID=UPI0035A389CA